MAARKSPAAKPAADDDAAPSFEQALERLETIVEQLEGGELTLEESLARYEEGVRLSRRLTQVLDQAERRIERLVESEGEGPPVTREEDLEEREDDSGEDPHASGTDEGRLPF